ncbi:MAG: c-type cytochrome, partial [Rhizobiales bacterium]|nr:c-type cytochrome [Rhizobacter sp.]
TPAAAPTVVAAAAPAQAGAVPALYTQLCQTCHAAGVAGAPKVGDKAAWAARLAEAKGLDGVVAIATKGKGAMPAKGGSNASDAEFRAVVTYMVNASK